MKKNLIILRAAAYTVLVLLVISSVQITTPPKEYSNFVDQLDKDMSGLMQFYGVPGASIALIHNGKVTWVKGYGYANKEKHIPVTEDTVFKAASVSKTVTAWGVMRLVEQGRLDLDAPVEKYLTRWHLFPSNFDNNGVTVRRLLSHTSGIVGEGYPGYNPGDLPTLEESLSGNTGDPAKVVQEPGKSFIYASVDYTLLQLLIEETSKQNFADYMDSEILKPLGMTHSSFKPNTEQNNTMKDATATGYDGFGRPVEDLPIIETAGVGLYTTAKDLAKLVSASMPNSSVNSTETDLLSSKNINLMMTPASRTEGVYGLGYVTETLSNGKKIVLHGGTNLGWNSIIALSPDQREGIVVMTNGDGGYYMNYYISGYWSKWAVSDIPSDSRFLQNINIIFLLIAGILGIELTVYLGKVISQIKGGNRRLGSKHSKKSVVMWALRIIIPILVAGLWLFLCYTEVPFELVFGLKDNLLFTFFPPTFGLISLLIILWGIILSSTAFIPVVKTLKDPN